jgi:tetratricopeptide (TPR) repeat protein
MTRAAPLRRQRLLAAVLIVLATLAVMGPVLGHEFVNWDDDRNLFRNPRLNPPSAASLRHYWTQSHMGLYVPVTFTAWTALAAGATNPAHPPAPAAQLNPVPFHAFGLALHLANALLVFALLTSHFPHEEPAPATAIAAAATGALLFALHPVQVEAVAWASGAKDLLGVTFSLLSLWHYLRFARADSRRRRRRRRRALHYTLALLLLVLAMLSKPSAMVVPAIAAALDSFVLRRPLRQVLRSALPLLAAVLPFAVVARLVQSTSQVDPTPIWAGPLLAGFSLAFYLLKLIVPARLAFDYGWRPALLLEQRWFYAAWLIPAVLAAVLWLYRRRAPALVAAALVFVIALAPVLGLVPFQFQAYSNVADHYLYLSMFGVALAAAWLMRSIPPQRRRAVLVVAGAILLALSVRSALQVGVWRDDQTLETHILSVNPNSFSAYANLASGRGVMGERAARQNRPAEARDHYRAAADLFQKSIDVSPYRRTYREGAPVFAAVYTRLASLQPDPPSRRATLDEGIRNLQALLNPRPGAPQLQPDDLQRIRTAVADLYAQAGDLPGAVREYEQALALQPFDRDVGNKLREARKRLESHP